MARKRGFVVYTDDEGGNWGIIASVNTATQNGQTLSGNPGAAPWGWKTPGTLRHVDGVDSTGLIHRRLTICDPLSAKYTIGGTFQDSLGTTFTVQSLIGEKKPANKQR